MALEELIKTRIKKYGAITIAEYMEIALSHPQHGYYMKRDPLGVAGDFITAPEISQVFGEIIGAWLAHNWQLLGAPEDIALVELGAGRGTLMADILRSTKNVKGFHNALSVHLVEISPILKQKQWKTLANKHPRIEWHNSVDSLPQLPLLLVANEFFDALPIHQFVDGAERMVWLDINDKLCFSADDGEVTETCEPAIAIIKKIAEHIVTHSGAALIIDYGYVEGSKGDTLQAMKNHAYCPVLENAGDADITAHVDFLSLAKAARGAGANVFEAIPQGAFLMRLGAGARTTALCEISSPEQQQTLISGLKRLADPQEMGELFKVMAITSKQISRAEGF
ncbi:MAG: SAM-dependent methyltransferase [Rickettsiales bacterium]|jgi:NADH dehydrogenase [ubiquinone] 1 alpha subcomplex assembly factor 7